MKLNLKQTIFGLFVILFLFFISGNALYSYKIFVVDRDAQTNQNLQKNAELLFDLVNKKFSDLKNNEEYVSFLVDSININLDRYINSQDDVVVIGVIKVSPKPTILKQYQNSRFSTRLSSKFNLTDKVFQDELLKAINSEQQKNKTWLFVPHPNIKTALQIIKKPRENTFIYAVVDLTSTFEVFSKDQTFTNKIIVPDQALSSDDSFLLKTFNYKDKPKDSVSFLLNGDSARLSYISSSLGFIVLSMYKSSSTFTSFLFYNQITFYIAIVIFGLVFFAGYFILRDFFIQLRYLESDLTKLRSGELENLINTSDSKYKEISSFTQLINEIVTEFKSHIKGKDALVAKSESQLKTLRMLTEQKDLSTKSNHSPFDDISTNIYTIGSNIAYKSQFEYFINFTDSIILKLEKSLDNFSHDKELEMFIYYLDELSSGFWLFGFDELIKKSKQTKQLSIDLKQKGSLSQNLSTLRSQALMLKIEFNKLLEKQDLELGSSFTAKDFYVEVSKNKIADFKEHVFRTQNLNLINHYVEGFLKFPVKNYLIIFNYFCLKQSKKHKKAFLGIRFQNEDLLVEPDSLMPLLYSMVYVLNFCIVHSIESPKNRRTYGKGEEGTIIVSFDEIINGDKKLFSIVIQDDGAGIDNNKVIELLSFQKTTEEISKLTPKEIQSMIFSPIFSDNTLQSSLDDFAYGLNIVQRLVLKNNGQIEIESEPGKGNTFTFIVPMA
jgi:hypothetical protein